MNKPVWMITKSWAANPVRGHEVEVWKALKQDLMREDKNAFRSRWKMLPQTIRVKLKAHAEGFSGGMSEEEYRGQWRYEESAPESEALNQKSMNPELKQRHALQVEGGWVEIEVELPKAEAWMLGMLNRRDRQAPWNSRGQFGKDPLTWIVESEMGVKKEQGDVCNEVKVLKILKEEVLGCTSWKEAKTHWVVKWSGAHNDKVEKRIYESGLVKGQEVLGLRPWSTLESVLELNAIRGWEYQKWRQKKGWEVWEAKKSEDWSWESQCHDRWRHGIVMLKRNGESVEMTIEEQKIWVSEGLELGIQMDARELGSGGLMETACSWGLAGILECLREHKNWPHLLRSGVNRRSGWALGVPGSLALAVQEEFKRQEGLECLKELSQWGQEEVKEWFNRIDELRNEHGYLYYEAVVDDAFLDYWRDGIKSYQEGIAMSKALDQNLKKLCKNEGADKENKSEFKRHRI